MWEELADQVVHIAINSLSANHAYPKTLYTIPVMYVVISSRLMTSAVDMLALSEPRLDWHLLGQHGTALLYIQATQLSFTQPHLNRSSYFTNIISGAPKKYPPKEFGYFFKNYTEVWHKILHTGYSFQTTCKIRDNFINWTCGKMFHIFSNAIFNSETVLGFGWMFQNSFMRRSPDTISPFHSNLESY